jgi:hypothetical protein
MAIIQTNIIGLPLDVLTLTPPTEYVLSWEACGERKQNPPEEPVRRRADQWDYG